LAWYDRNGTFLGSIGGPGSVFEPAISPDEKSVVFRRIAPPTRADLWLWDLTRRTEQRFTTETSMKFAPFWAPQGDRIVYAAARGGSIFNLYQKASSGMGQEELLLANGNSKFPSQWSRNGRFIVYTEIDPNTKRDIWVLPMDGGAARKPVPVLRSEFNELHGQLSPDDHWMAYTSDKTGQREVYVVAFPSGIDERKVSVAGGNQPRWRDDGKELYFVAADGKLMAVGVKAIEGTKAYLELGALRPLFEAHLPLLGRGSVFEYDVTTGGKRFLLDEAEFREPAPTPPLTVVVNWDTGFKK
jgi:Tol biopolymer transport system component